jgi:hypothetical protein
MNDHPDALELIRIAYQTLAQDILPDALPEQRYTLRMIANALGIAARELEARDADTTMETRGLDTLYGETNNAEDLHQRNRQLSRDIRRGVFESYSAQPEKLRQHLIATARAKLAAAYPKALMLSKQK